jgi:hypothetical protein
MKTLLLTTFLLFATSKVPVQEKEWLGSIHVFMTDDDQIEVQYNGNYQKCFVIYLVKRVCVSCDSTINEPYLDSIFNFQSIQREVPKKPIKTKRM